MCSREFQKQPIWLPNENSGKRMKEFIRSIEIKYMLKFTDYYDFHKWSVNNISEFWAEIWNASGVIYSKSYDKVVDLSVPMEDCPKWFEGARLNIAENLLKNRDDRIALIAAGEDRDVERLSYKQLYEETRIYAAALKKLGLQTGDIVACYMSNRIEAVIAMLAVTSIGAIWNGIWPTIGSSGFLKRMKQVKPKFLFTVDQFPLNKETIYLLENIKDIVIGLPSLEKVIIVPSKKEPNYTSITDIKKSYLLNDFKRLAYGIDGTVPELVFEQVPFSHPAFITYTSGSTGISKMIVHGFELLLIGFRDYELHYNGQPNDIWLSATTATLISWVYSVTLLFLHSSLVQFEGVPYHLSPTFLWDLVDELKITKINIRASTLEKMAEMNYIPTEKHELTSLEAIRTGGRVIIPRLYDFAINKIKPGLALIVRYASAEAAGFCVNDMTLPVYLGEISPCLGVAAECLDHKGNHLLGEMGEFAISKPLPSLPLKMWGDTTGELYKKRYFSKYPGKFTIGDTIAINPETKGIIVCGRSEEMLKQSGCQFGSSVIYNVVKLFTEIEDSLCVGKFGKDADETVILFVQMKGESPFNEDLKSRLRKSIANELSGKHVPKVILQAPAIPYNSNGKKTEIIVKRIINNLPYDTDTMANPECLQFYYNVAKFGYEKSD